MLSSGLWLRPRIPLAAALLWCPQQLLFFSFASVNPRGCCASVEIPAYQQQFVRLSDPIWHEQTRHVQSHSNTPFTSILTLWLPAVPLADCTLQTYNAGGESVPFFSSWISLVVSQHLNLICAVGMVLKSLCSENGLAVFFIYLSSFLYQCLICIHAAPQVSRRCCRSESRKHLCFV